MRIAILNGPNLNLLGTREPDIYGRETLADIEQHLRAVAKELKVTLQFAQMNGEGEMVDAIQALRGKCDGAVINAGAYTHTSLAIPDAFRAAQVPYVEVHISNIFAREPERRRTTLAGGAVALITGLGTRGYEFALRGLVAKLHARG